MIKHFYLILRVVVTVICVWHSSLWAKDPDSIPLVYREFEIPDEPESNVVPGKAVKMPKKRIKIAGTTEKTAAIHSLEELVLKKFNGPQDGYIQLSETEFIIFVANTGRVGLGLYLVDLSTNTISEYPFAHGYVEIKSALKDKPGNDYLLLSHSYPLHGGSGGGAYSLLSARMSRRGKAVIDLLELGDFVFFEDDIANVCKEKEYRKRILNDEVTAKVVDKNKDGYPDIVITIKQMHCATMKTTMFTTTYFADSHSFRSIVGKGPHDVVEKLLDAQKRALEIFSKTKDKGTVGEILQKAGVQQFLYEKPEAMSLEAYASLLNDYAFFTGPYFKARQAVDILDRVITISPHRAVAFLNRAELLYQMLSLGDMKTQAEKTIAAKEIMNDYGIYKKLSGKTLKQWENFCSFNLASYPKEMNVCEYIHKYHTVSRITDIQREEEIYLETRRLDIDNDGVVDDVSFEPGQYGYKTYSGFTIMNPRGDKVTFKGTISRKPNTGYGFKIFAFEGKIYKSLAMLDISLIDHDKERMVCESEWVELGDGRKELKAMKITP